MRSFLSLDCETTGLDPTTDKVIEVGWALFDIEQKRLVLAGGEYVNRRLDPKGADDRVNFSDTIKDITKIEHAWLETYGISETAMRARLDTLTAGGLGLEAIVAHHAQFDRAFLKGMGWETELPWICTLNDLPANVGQKSLRYLALDRAVLSFFPHRAMFDAIQCAAVLNTFDFYQVRERSKSPMVILAADVTFKENQKAKNLEFKWERPFRHDDLRIPRTWCKGLKAMDLHDEQVKCGKAGVMTHVVEMPAATNGDTK